MSVEVIKDADDQQQFDATRLEGLDPAFKYRWVRKDPVNLTRKEMIGYEVVQKTPEMVHLVNDRTKIKKGEDTSSAVEWGDMILMRLPRDRYEARLARKREKTLRQTKGVAQAYKQTIARMAAAQDGRPLAFEEHKDVGGYHGQGVSAEELASELDNMSENDAPRIGRRR